MNQKQINETSLLAGIIGQIGCVTVIIIAVSLGVGVLLDNFLNTGSIFTILFLVGSVPVTLYLTVRVSLMAVARMQKNQQITETEEDKAT